MHLILPDMGGGKQQKRIGEAGMRVGEGRGGRSSILPAENEVYSSEETCSGQGQSPVGKHKFLQ